MARALTTAEQDVAKARDLERDRVAWNLPRRSVTTSADASSSDPPVGAIRAGELDRDRISAERTDGGDT